MSINPFEESAIPYDTLGELSSPEDMLSPDVNDAYSEYALNLPVPLPEEPVSDFDFDENLVNESSAGKISKLSYELIEDIQQDKESRKEWESIVRRGMKYLGWSVRNGDAFQGACGAFDSTLSLALITTYSTCKPELFPVGGPAKGKVNGYPTVENQQKADRVKTFLNFYLTQEDKSYYPDSDRLLLYEISCGSAFRKIYQDPITGNPVGRGIAPQNLIVDIHTKSLLDSSRITEVVYLSRREVLLNQESGEFIVFDLPDEVEEDDDEDLSDIDREVERIQGTNSESSENKSLFKFYQSHVDLPPEVVGDSYNYEYAEEQKEEDIRDNSLPRAYIVTICTATNQIVSIRRNWEPEDPTYKKKQYFVHWYYLPGFGIYGIGLFHLMLSNAIACTSILRQTIDSATRKNFPGGFMAKGMRLEENDITAGPGTFTTIDTGNLKISDVLMLTPYGEPSQVLIELRDKIIQQMSMISNALNMETPEYNSQAPVGTTMILTELQGKIMSAVLSSQHNALDQELKLFCNLFSKCLPETGYPFNVEGNSSAIMREDFSDDVNICPVSDPNVLTTAHKLVQSESILRLSEGAPQLYNQREVHRRMLEAMKVPDIDKILIPEAQIFPLDPVTENSNAIMGMALKTGEFQDHPAHIATHMPYNNLPNMAAHIREHQAQDQRLKMQMEMGMQLPPLEQLMIPEVQNRIAIMAAQISIQQQQQQQPQDPNQLMYEASMADIQQREKAALLKDEEIKLKTEVELEKARLSYESEIAKIDAQLEIAREKNATTLAVSHMKQPGVYEQ